MQRVTPVVWVDVKGSISRGLSRQPLLRGTLPGDGLIEDGGFFDVRETLSRRRHQVHPIDNPYGGLDPARLSSGHRELGQESCHNPEIMSSRNRNSPLNNQPSDIDQTSHLRDCVVGKIIRYFACRFPPSSNVNSPLFIYNLRQLILGFPKHKRQSFSFIWVTCNLKDIFRISFSLEI